MRIPPFRLVGREFLTEARWGRRWGLKCKEAFAWRAWGGMEGGLTEAGGLNAGGSPVLFRHVPNTVHAVTIRASNRSWLLHVVGPYYHETYVLQGRRKEVINHKKPPVPCP